MTHGGGALPTGRAPATVRALAASLLDALDPLTEHLVRAILAEDPSYSGPTTEEDLRASCRANLEHVLRTVAGDDDPADPATLDAPRATGDRRARQGVPLESVLHAYRLGFRCIWEAMLREARRRGDGTEALAEGATDVWEVVDLFSSAVADAYRRAEHELARRDAHRRDELVDALLEGRGADRSLVAEAAAALELPQRAAFAVVVASGGEGAPAALDQAGLRAVWRVRGDTDVGVVLLPDGTGSATVVDALSSTRVRAGVSPPVDGLPSLDRGLRGAVTALTALPPGGPAVAELDALLPAALVASTPDLADRLVHTVLGGVLTADPVERDVLLQTLQAWLATGGSAHRTAERLYCHRNTVRSRLRRLETLTGRSTERADHLAELWLALLALSLRRRGTRPAPQPLA